MGKWLILYQNAVANFSPKYVSCMGRDIAQGHDNKMFISSANVILIGQSWSFYLFSHLFISIFIY